MIIKKKLTKIGHSWGIIIPMKIVAEFSPNEEIELDIIMPSEKEKPTETMKEPKITFKNHNHIDTSNYNPDCLTCNPSLIKTSSPKPEPETPEKVVLPKAETNNDGKKCIWDAKLGRNVFK